MVLLWKCWSVYVGLITKLWNRHGWKRVRNSVQKRKQQVLQSFWMRKFSGNGEIIILEADTYILKYAQCEASINPNKMFSTGLSTAMLYYSWRLEYAFGLTMPKTQTVQRSTVTVSEVFKIKWCILSESRFNF